MSPTLHRATSLKQACELMQTLPIPMVYGGGTAIQILLKQEILFADNLVDIGALDELRGISTVDGGVKIGALTSLREVELSETVQRELPLMALVYGKVANARIRNTASVGGNISHGDYRLDPPTALLVHDATVLVASANGSRSIPIREFFEDFQMTALRDGEIVTGLVVPPLPPASGYAYVKQSSLARNDWPVASVAVAVTGAVGSRAIHIGLGALAPTPIYVTVDATGLDQQQAVQAAMTAARAQMDPLPDVRGSAEYKRTLGLVGVEEATTTAWRMADHE